MSMDAPESQLGTLHVCRECERELEASEFYWKTQKETQKVYKHSSLCRACYQLSRRAYQQEYLKNYNKPDHCPEKREESRIKSYGLSLKDYDELLETQGGGCAICGSAEPKTKRNGRFCVDHNHETNEVRGLLCAPCNRGLGLFGDDPKVISRAVQYLYDKGHYGKKWNC